jgi:hypothetical protein
VLRRSVDDQNSLAIRLASLATHFAQDVNEPRGPFLERISVLEVAVGTVLLTQGPRPVRYRPGE